LEIVAREKVFWLFVTVFSSPRKKVRPLAQVKSNAYFSSERRRLWWHEHASSWCARRYYIHPKNLGLMVSDFGCMKNLNFERRLESVDHSLHRGNIFVCLFVFVHRESLCVNCCTYSVLDDVCNKEVLSV